uniref:Tetraspanin n=1 Tax=Macrostomum lignano TaxID=282301 RepID=A0A1I8F482_9PLAT
FLALESTLCTSAELGRFSDVIAAMETLKASGVILIGCGCVILLSLYGNDTDPSGRLFTDAVDNIQREEQCCGWSGLGSPSLFNSTPWFRVINANSSGLLDRLIDVSGTFIHATIGTVIAAILLQIVCLICAIVLLCQIRRAAQMAGSIADLGKYSELLAGVSLMRSLRYLLIGCGCFTILIAMCGCCVGVCKENRCLLGVYVILLFLVLFINLAAAIMAVDRLKRHYGNLTIKESKMFTEAIDKLQRNDKCCGWAGLDKQQNFFLSTPWYQQQSSNPAQFPDSCCALRQRKMRARPKNEQEGREGGFIHEHDCLDNLVAMNGVYMRAALITVILAILLQ